MQARTTKDVADFVLCEERARIRKLEQAKEEAKRELAAAQARQAAATSAFEEGLIETRRQHVTLAVMIASICDQVHRRNHESLVAAQYEELRQSQRQTPSSQARPRPAAPTLASALLQQPPAPSLRTNSLRVSEQPSPSTAPTTIAGPQTGITEAALPTPTPTVGATRRYTLEDGSARWPPSATLSSAIESRGFDAALVPTLPTTPHVPPLAAPSTTVGMAPPPSLHTEGADDVTHPASAARQGRSGSLHPDEQDGLGGEPVHLHHQPPPPAATEAVSSSESPSPSRSGPATWGSSPHRAAYDAALEELLNDVITDPSLDAVHLNALANVLANHATRRGPKPKPPSPPTLGFAALSQMRGRSHTSPPRAHRVAEDWVPSAEAVFGGRVDALEGVAIRQGLQHVPQLQRADANDDDDVAMIEAALSKPRTLITSRGSPQRFGSL